MYPKPLSKVLIFVFVLSLLGCTPQKLVSFNQKNQEPFTNSNLQNFLKNNPNPKIVLRVPNVDENVTTKFTSEQQIVTKAEKERNDLYYSAIEKELLKAGFSVRDRGLFNEVLKKMERDAKENINYSQIKDLTNTDLILEVVKIDPSVEYTTNKYYTVSNRGKKKESVGGQYKKYGASAEFKIIMVSNNELAGSYKFHYTPCMEGCPASSFVTPKLNLKTGAPKAYVGVEYDIMEEFITQCAKDLIKSTKTK